MFYTVGALFGWQQQDDSAAFVSNGTILVLQFAVLALGLAGSLYTAKRIAHRRYLTPARRLSTPIPIGALIVVLGALNVAMFLFTTVAHALGEPRQKINYHLRALERLDLLRLVEERPRRGLTERVMVASVRSYVLAPAVLGESAADPARTDRLSTGYLIAIAARMVGEVAELALRAEKARKPLATIAIDTEIRFASAAYRAAFTAELSGVVASLAAGTTMRGHREGVGIVS